MDGANGVSHPLMWPHLEEVQIDLAYRSGGCQVALRADLLRRCTAKHAGANVRAKHRRRPSGQHQNFVSGEKNPARPPSGESLRVNHGALVWITSARMNEFAAVGWITGRTRNCAIY